jgi:hypothetical protein
LKRSLSAMGVIVMQSLNDYSRFSSSAHGPRGIQAVPMETIPTQIQHKMGRPYRTHPFYFYIGSLRLGAGGQAREF